MLSFSDDISDTLKIIFFDLGAVLVHVNLCQFYKRMALLTQTSPDDVMTLVGEFESLSQQFELGNINPKAFYQTIVDRFDDQSFSYTDFVSAYTDLFSLNRPLWSVAEQLKESYTLSIISNTDALHYHRICKDYPIDQVFTQPVTSYTVHQRKPDPDIYQTALDRFDIEPSQALFIDDRWENIEGATRLGMTSLHYVTTEKLVHDLYMLGLECES